jgi:hypothetical protein
MGYELERVSRKTSRELQQLTDRAAAERAAIQAGEGSASYLAHQRISNGYDLAEHAYNRATRLNRLVNETSRDNTSLELTGRRLEAACELGACDLVIRYMGRR